MIRVLFVDTDPVRSANARRSCATMRREWDMKFFVEVGEVLAFMEEHAFDVVVAGADASVSGGIHLLEHIRRVHPRVVRILLVDPVAGPEATRGIASAHRILAQPADPAEVRDAVDRALELEQRLHDPDLLSMVSAAGSLPMPSAELLRLNELAAQPDCDFDDVADVLGGSPAMTAKVLQAVNSAYFSLPLHVTDVRSAVGYLGLDAVRNMCAAVELSVAFNDVEPIVEGLVGEVHEHCLAVASATRELLDGRAKASEAFVAGMLVDVGLLLLAARMPERFLELRVQAMRTQLPLRELEEELLGAQHADLGAHLLDLWGLPVGIVEAVARHHDEVALQEGGLDVQQAVRVADSLVCARASAVGTLWSSVETFDAEQLERAGVVDVLRVV